MVSSLLQHVDFDCKLTSELSGEFANVVVVVVHLDKEHMALRPFSKHLDAFKRFSCEGIAKQYAGMRLQSATCTAYIMSKCSAES